MKKNGGSSKKILLDAFVSGYFVASFICAITNKYSVFDTHFTTDISLVAFITIYAVSTAVIAGYGSIVPLASYLSLPVTAVIYSSYMSYVSGSFYVALASGGICSLAIYICANQIKSYKNEQIKPRKVINYKKIPVAVITCTAIIFIVYTFMCSVLKYKSYFPDATQAKYAQMMYIIGETGIQATTLESSVGNLLVHFSVHISPVLYVLFPIFKLFPSVLTLSFINSLAAAISVIPMYFICRRHKLSSIHTVCLSVLVLIYPAVFTSVSGGFSELCFLLPLILSTLLFIESRKYVCAAIFSLLTLSVHETAALYLIFAGLYFLSVSSQIPDIIERKKFRIFSGSLSLFSFVYLLFCLIIISNSGVGLNLTHYLYGLGSDANLSDVIKNIVTNPTSVLAASFNANKLNFIIMLLLPALPAILIKKNRTAIILLIPVILLNILPSGTYNSGTLFPTVTACASVILYIVALALSESTKNPEEQHENNKRISLPSALLAISLIFAFTFNIFQIPTTAGESISYIKEHKAEIDEIDEVIAKIPDNAEISAPDTFLSHLSQRPQLYRLSSEKETDYVIIDLRQDIISSSDQKYNIEYYENKGYKIYIYKEDITAVMVKPDN